jgi:hypothetical protein
MFKKLFTVILIVFICFSFVTCYSGQDVEAFSVDNYKYSEINVSLSSGNSDYGFIQDTVIGGRLAKLLEEQELGPVWPFNPIKYAIRGAVKAGVPENTIVLLLLLPLVAAIIAATRHLVGIRGFGIFLPAALSIVFVSTGPVVGIGMFLIIVFVSTFSRILLRRFKVRLQYLPRMALYFYSS